MSRETPIIAHLNGVDHLKQRIAAMLRRALTADLSLLKRGDLTLMRADLKAMKSMQAMCGQVAPRLEWSEAQARVDAELGRRENRV